MDDSFETSPPYRLRRNKNQASYAKSEIYALLDTAALCHLGVVIDGSPVVIPTLYARRANEILVHGSRASSVLASARSGSRVNLVVTVIDALVLPDSIFEHTIDYSSVSVAGTAREITSNPEKSQALTYLSEAVLPGRYAKVREPSESELRQSTVLSIEIEDASLKFSHTDLTEIDSPGVWTGRIALGARPLAVQPSASWLGQEGSSDLEAMAAKYR